MIEEEKECIDIITQLSAVRSSIDRVMGMIVAENLKRLFRESRKRSSRTSTEAGTSDSDDHQEIVALFFRKRLFS